MKQLVCEMCGGTDLIKQDGVFVCQNCGIKYSVEEAKKMMIQGTVDVSGSTVKIDNSDKLNNLLILARRAKDEDDIENAFRYYSEIYLIAPQSWEAAFYSKMFNALNSTMGKLAIGIQGITKNLDTVFELIRSQEPTDSIQGIVKRLMIDIHKNIMVLDNAVMRSNAYDLISDDYYYTVAELHYEFANRLISNFGMYEYAYVVYNWAYGPYPYYLGELEEKFQIIQNKLGKSRPEMLIICQAEES